MSILQVLALREYIGCNDDPELFLMDNKPPLILDEVQYIPSIFKKIKIDVDKTNESGRFFMTGSQQFSMMKNVTESLAGRAGILSLLPLSFREVNGDTETEQFIPTEEYIQRRTASALKYDTGYLWEFILNGGMPAFYSGRKCSFEAFYSSYLRTYIDRDISSLAQIGDKGRFVAFLPRFFCTKRNGANQKCCLQTVVVHQQR